MPPHLPKPPRQQSVLKSSHDFSITRPIHPYTFFYQCMYRSIHLPVFYHCFHPSTHPWTSLPSPKHLPHLSLHAPSQPTLSMSPLCRAEAGSHAGGLGSPLSPKLGDIAPSPLLHQQPPAALPAEPGGMDRAPAPLGLALSGGPWARGWVTAGVANCLPKFLTKTPICAIYSAGSNLWRPVLRSVIKHWSNNTLQDGLQDT